MVPDNDQNRHDVIRRDLAEALDVRKQRVEVPPANSPPSAIEPADFIVVVWCAIEIVPLNGGLGALRRCSSHLPGRSCFRGRSNVRIEPREGTP
jgi:hypothetical protein